VTECLLSSFKKGDSKLPRIPWNDELTAFLLGLVKQRGLHLQKGTMGISDKWKTLYEDFFQAHPALKEAAYIQDYGFRRFKEKFEKILIKHKEIKKMGNVAQLPLYFDQVEEIMEEIVIQEEEIQMQKAVMYEKKRMEKLREEFI
jgi:hypothetical protein